MTAPTNEPLLVSVMRRKPTGEVRHQPESGPKTGTSTRGFLAELDEMLAEAVKDALTDVKQRLQRADVELQGLLPHHHPQTGEQHRLGGKAEGVRLALGYVEEALR